jgi:CDP-diacylglycerol--glycerol-3-phosphate 3-phosphatidyltransferase
MNAPNLITLSRILIAPLFAFAFMRGFRGGDGLVWLWLSVSSLVLIEISDALDGKVARSANLVSDFGKFFDPLADSMSRLTVFCAFLVTEIIPIWMFLILLYRDIIVSAIRYMCIKQGVVVSARFSGKLKAILQAAGSFGVVFAVMAQPYHLTFIPQVVAGRHIGFYIMLIPALYTAYSAVDYWWGNRKVLLGK